MLASADPYPLYSYLRENEPVHRIGGSDFYLVSTWNLVNEVLMRTDEFSSNLTATMVLESGGARPFRLAGLGDRSHVLATADDPAHATHRKTVLPSVVARRILALEPFIDSTVRRLWSDALADGAIDWVDAVSDRLPMIVVARLVGFPAPDVSWLVAGAYATTQMLDGVITDEQLATATTAAAELAGYDFTVQVTSNGTDFVRFDSASHQPTAVGSFAFQDPRLIGGLAGKDPGGWGTVFDLGALSNQAAVRDGTVDLSAITHVRLRDVVGASDYPNVGDSYLDSFGRQIFDAHLTTGSGGFDLRAVGVLNQAA